MTPTLEISTSPGIFQDITLNRLRDSPASFPTYLSQSYHNGSQPLTQHHKKNKPINQLNLVAQTTHINTQNILTKTSQTTDKTAKN